MIRNSNSNNSKCGWNKHSDQVSAKFIFKGVLVFLKHTYNMFTNQ